MLSVRTEGLTDRELMREGLRTALLVGFINVVGCTVAGWLCYDLFNYVLVRCGQPRITVWLAIAFFYFLRQLALVLKR